MGMLSFEKPKKLRKTKKHNKMYQSDSGIAGTYVPNMSKEDMNLWKAKHIKGNDERVEIRKTLNGVQVLVIIYKNIRHTEWTADREEWSKNHKNVQISMNGKLQMSFYEYNEMTQAIKEAQGILLISKIINKNDFSVDTGIFT